jgi:hypothetical protein
MVMLVVMQFLMGGNVSFTGHLCGIISGFMEIYGLLDFVLVNNSYLHEMEQWDLLRPFTCKENFVATPTTNNNSNSNSNTTSDHQFRRDPRKLLRSIRVGVQLFFQFCWNVLVTLQVAIFGRGQRANSNIQFGRIRNPWATTAQNTTAAVHDQTDNDLGDAPDDEEWGGLPLIDRQAERPQQSQLL